MKRLADQLWPDLADGRPLVVLPLGSCEQHGPHGGNLPSMSAAIATLRGEGRDAAWWPCTPRGADLHAGHAETSMMLRLRSAAVRTERAAAGPCEPIERLLDRLIATSVRGVSESGVLGDPSGASAQHGEELLAGMAVQLAEDIKTWRVTRQGRLGRLSSAPAPAQHGGPA